jgi:transcriptional regulator with XRE-family HTH domain
MSSEVMPISVKHAYPLDSTILNFKTRTLVRMDFKGRLAAGMRHAGVSGAELSRALGISSQAVSLVLGGHSKALTAENTAKAARFLGVDLYWLATGEGQMTPLSAEQGTGLTPEALQIAKWFDRLQDPRDRAVAETAAMGAILERLQKHDLPPIDRPAPAVEAEEPPAPSRPPAPTPPPKPAKTHRPPAERSGRKG